MITQKSKKYVEGLALTSILVTNMLNKRTNRYYSPEELEGEDDIPVDIETLD